MALLSLREVAQQLGISPTTLHRHVQDGNIAYVDIGHRGRRYYRFTQEAVDAFIRQQSRREIGNDFTPTRRKMIVPGQGVKSARTQGKRSRRLSPLRFLARGSDG